MIAGILERRRQGLSLGTGEISRGENPDGALYHRAITLFGNWKDGLKAAGLDPDAHVKTRVSPYRRPEAVLKEIRRRRRKRLSLSSSQLVQDKKTGDLPLYQKAVVHFGSWHEALRQAGVDPKSIVRHGLAFPDTKSVLSGIRDRAHDGISLHAGWLSFGPCVNRPLLDAARKHFGDWGAAVEASGFSREEAYAKPRGAPGRFPEPDDVLAELRRLAGTGVPMKYLDVQREAGPGFCAYVTKLFGSWRAALHTASISVPPRRR